MSSRDCVRRDSRDITSCISHFNTLGISEFPSCGSSCGSPRSTSRFTACGMSRLRCCAQSHAVPRVSCPVHACSNTCMMWHGPLRASGRLTSCGLSRHPLHTRSPPTFLPTVRATLGATSRHTLRTNSRDILGIISPIHWREAGHVQLVGHGHRGRRSIAMLAQNEVCLTATWVVTLERIRPVNEDYQVTVLLQ